MFAQAKKQRKSIRRKNLEILYKVSNIAKQKDIKVNKFYPSQILVDGKLVWEQYQLLKNDYIRSEVVINKQSKEAEVDVFCDKGLGYITDIAYIMPSEDKRVNARLAMLKKQLEQKLAK